MKGSTRLENWAGYTQPHSENQKQTLCSTWTLQLRLCSAGLHGAAPLHSIKWNKTCSLQGVHGK